MDKLEKIIKTLKLQRAHIESEIVSRNSRLKSLTDQIEQWESRKTMMGQAVFSGNLSDDLVGNAVTLEKWHEVIAMRTRLVHNQTEQIYEELRPLKRALKELIVKEDILTSRLNTHLKTERKSRLEHEASTRLENWVDSLRRR